MLLVKDALLERAARRRLRSKLALNLEPVKVIERLKPLLYRGFRVVYNLPIFPDQEFL